MRILGIETSCDETAAALIEKDTDNHLMLMKQSLSSSMLLHAKTGGIIPEVAAREQLRYILPVIKDVLSEKIDIDAIAVTVGPGLIGSLLVGVETAKTLAMVWKKPIIPVNHLIGHIYANFISGNSIRQSGGRNSKLASTDIKFPAVALIVSGGHTDLILMKGHGSIQWLGGTRDDAAGEAFDKIGRLLGLPYPAGPAIEKLAKSGNPKRFHFPKALLSEDNFAFSFSGLKTAVFREVKTMKQPARNAAHSAAGGLSNETIADVAAGVQQSIIDVLVAKTLKAAQQYKARSILLGGGVAANESLRDQFIQNTRHQIPDTEIFFPEKFLCTDNAAMIAAAGALIGKPQPWSKIQANPELYL